MLEGPVLLVGLGLQHLILQLGDLLFVELDVSFHLLPIFLVGNQSGTIGFQLAYMRLEGLLNHDDVLGKGGDLFVKCSDVLV